MGNDITTFDADPFADTFTPVHQFLAPGTFLVGLRVTDMNDVAHIGTLYVSVVNLAPEVDPGPDQTVAEGGTVQFNGSVSDPGGPIEIVAVEWDFDFDGGEGEFHADPSAHNNLTPAHQYTSPGLHRAALRATDVFGETTVAEMTVLVTNVAPTAVVTCSTGAGSTGFQPVPGSTGFQPVPEGSPVTITVSNVSDPNPNAVISYSVDWTGSGEFRAVTDRERTVNADGSVSFQHVYEDNNGPANYSAVVRVADDSGGFTEYVRMGSIPKKV